VPGERTAHIWSFLHEDLDEGALLGIVFPGSGLLAGFHLHDHVADPARFAGLHLEVLRDVVALVEQADRGHPVLHRRADGVPGHGGGSGVLGEFLGNLGLDRFRRGGLVVARGQRGERQQREGPHDQASGVQAS